MGSPSLVLDSVSYHSLPHHMQVILVFTLN